ncbi:MAG: hypothetical protein LBE21_01020, partial [Pseudomonadales bacterium]|nr:hypothetical protein [Pseudomonadales bacterium]
YKFVQATFRNDFSGKIADFQCGDGPLKVGYLCADFRPHATMFLLAGVLKQHVGSDVAVELFSINRGFGGRYLQQLRSLPLRYHNLASYTDAEAAAYIRQQGIHILVDLNGHAGEARRGILCQRPAPIQVNWLGYPGTMGDARLADYIIGDAVVTPLEHAAHFSETLALMPHCYQPNDDTREILDALSRTEEGLPAVGFIYGCFCKLEKINPETFTQWCHIVAQTPGSVLWLLDPKTDAYKLDLRHRASLLGVTPERLIFAPSVSHYSHLGRLKFVDLLLDTYPSTSHTTASDGLWAGVPIVTRMGETFTSRVAASLLSAHDFAELITTDAQNYTELALSLAHDRTKLTAIRQRLQAATESSPLFDTRRFTRDLERLYKEMWRHHKTPGKEREPIVLSPSPL